MPVGFILPNFVVKIFYVFEDGYSQFFLDVVFLFLGGQHYVDVVLMV